MIPMDHLDGYFEFETEIGKDEKGFYARAQGFEARHPNFQDQAINDLNEKVFDAISRGDLVPNLGN